MSIDGLDFIRTVAGMDGEADKIDSARERAILEHYVELFPARERDAILDEYGEGKSIPYCTDNLTNVNVQIERDKFGKTKSIFLESDSKKQYIDKKYYIDLNSGNGRATVLIDRTFCATCYADDGKYYNHGKPGSLLYNHVRIVKAEENWFDKLFNRKFK